MTRHLVPPSSLLANSLQAVSGLAKLCNVRHPRSVSGRKATNVCTGGMAHVDERSQGGAVLNLMPMIVSGGWLKPRLRAPGKVSSNDHLIGR